MALRWYDMIPDTKHELEREMMTTIKLCGGDLGLETVMVRCDLTQASAPIEVDYCEGEGWQPTQFQCADTRHTVSGLAKRGQWLAAYAIEADPESFDCDWEEVG